MPPRRFQGCSRGQRRGSRIGVPCGLRVREINGTSPKKPKPQPRHPQGSDNPGEPLAGRGRGPLRSRSPAAAPRRAAPRGQSPLRARLQRGFSRRTAPAPRAAAAHGEGRGGARRRSPAEGHILSPGSFSRLGAAGRELDAAPPGEAGAGREARRGRGLLAAQAPVCGAGCLRGHRRRGQPPTLPRRGRSLEPGRSGAGASPSVSLRAVCGRRCRRRSPGRFSSIPLPMDPLSTGPALQSE